MTEPVPHAQEIDERRWVVAIGEPRRSLHDPRFLHRCNRCQEATCATLFRRFDEFDLDKFYCGACVEQLDRFDKARRANERIAAAASAIADKRKTTNAPETLARAALGAAIGDVLEEYLRPVIDELEGAGDRLASIVRDEVGWRASSGDPCIAQSEALKAWNKARYRCPKEAA